MHKKKGVPSQQDICSEHGDDGDCPLQEGGLQILPLSAGQCGEYNRSILPWTAGTARKVRECEEIGV